MLSIQNLQYSAGNFSLGPINLELSPTGYLCVIGPTGSGKTVFLELLAGLRRAKEGRIFFKGQDISSLAAEKRGFGFAYQDSLLYPFLNVEQNILFAARLQGRLKEASVHTRKKLLMERMGLSSLGKRFPQHLSGGEKQRVSLARALLLRPALLLLDEPLSALDSDKRLEMRRLLKEIHATEQCAIIHVSHDLQEVKELADQVYRMEAGSLQKRSLDKVLLGT